MLKSKLTICALMPCLVMVFLCSSCGENTENVLQAKLNVSDEDVSSLLGLENDQLPENVIKLEKMDFSDEMDELFNIENIDIRSKEDESEDVLQADEKDLENEFPDPDKFLSENFPTKTWAKDAVFCSDVLNENDSPNLEHYVCLNESARDSLISSLEAKYSNTRGIFGSHDNYSKHLPTINKLHSETLEEKRKVCNLMLKITTLQTQIQRLISESKYNKEIQEEILKSESEIDKFKAKLKTKEEEAILKDKEKILDYVLESVLTEKRACKLLKAYTAITSTTNSRSEEREENEAIETYRGINWFDVDIKYRDNKSQEEKKIDHMEISTLQLPENNSDLTVVSLYRDPDSTVHIIETNIVTQGNDELSKYE